MILFNLLWLPLLYLLWRCISEEGDSSGGVWAILAGTLAALIQLFAGSMVNPGEFGFSRWVGGFVDIVALPALIPFIIYLILIGLKIFSGTPDFATFALLWLFPASIVRGVFYRASGDPVLLVLTPVLWTAIAVGVPFFINHILQGQRSLAVPCAFGILAIPLAATSAYWAFFSNKVLLGAMFFFVAVAPMLVSLILLITKTSNNR
jgi:hypothetical protein